MKKERYFKDELRKLFIGYAIAPAFLITLVCGLVFMAALVYGRKNSNEEHNRYVASQLNQVLEAYEEVLDLMSLNADIFDGNQDSKGRVTVFEDFYQVSNQLGYEADMFLMDENRQVILSNRQEIPSSFIVKEGISWGIFSSMERQAGQTAVQLVDGWKKQDGKVAMGKAVMEDGKICGYLIFTIDSTQFKTVIEKTDAQTVIADRFGWVYLSGNSSFVNSSNQMKKILKNSESLMRADGHLYLVTSQWVYRDLFQVYSVSDIQNLVASLALSGILILTVLLLMTAWIFANSKKVTDKKTKDFYQILDTMEMAQKGNLDDTIEIKRDNEFKFIADAYNEMIASLKRQMENNKRMSELVAISQNKQLESQFNPHFLYNTLESIRYMVKLDPAIAQKMIYSLSSLLRYSMDGNKEEVSLKEDLDHLNNYLTILKYRYNQRFSYQVQVEPEVTECRIPKLVLQPMIENSVKYGFVDRDTLKVELKAYIHEETLTLICRDDGAGMTPGVLSEITELLKQEENRSRHSGLYNIHRRIEILYGHPYGVEIRSTEGFGTTLVVTLPAHREEPYAENLDC